MSKRLLAAGSLETFERSDGSVIVRLLCQYNNADLIKLYR